MMTTDYLYCDVEAQCKLEHYIKRFVDRDEDNRRNAQSPDCACNASRLHEMYSFLTSGHRRVDHLGAATMADRLGKRMIEVTEYHFETFALFRLVPEELPARNGRRRNKISIARLSARATSH